MAKKYQVIARKYRPQAFRDVVGQEAVVTTLKNALRFDKVAHAYLFCGSRGVGKTTLARLFAKALNCLQPTADFEPCNQCPSCQEIVSGQSLDVIEIDGASNRGIDDIRQINETVGYAPSHGKYKIYIIDEVHMLTKEAFNALLKTLEEPPERAKFFFATTESHKVLPTIISRCQRFDLARISPDLIVSKLQQITQDLQRETELEALHLIASFADGSLRDAESLFDQILCFADGAVTAADVRRSLGLVPQDLFFSLDQAFANFQLSYAFELVDQLFQTGKDLTHFLEQLIEHYRQITLFKTLPTPPSLPPDLFNRYAASARLYTQAQALSILDTLIHTELNKSSFPRITLESILLQIIRTKNKIPLEVLVRRLEEMKSEVASTPQAKPAEPIAPPAPQIQPVVTPAIQPTPVAQAQAVEPITPPAPQIVQPVAAPAIQPTPVAQTQAAEPITAPVPQIAQPIATPATQIQPIVTPAIQPTPVAQAQAAEPITAPAPQIAQPIATPAIQPTPVAQAQAAEPIAAPAPQIVQPVAAPAIQPTPVAQAQAAEPITAPVPQVAQPVTNSAIEPTPVAQMQMAEPIAAPAPRIVQPVVTPAIQPKPVAQAQAPMTAPVTQATNISTPTEAKAPAASVSYDTLLRFAAVELEGTLKLN